MASYQSSSNVQEDTIFVTGLPEETTDEQLADYFGQIGIIKIDKKTREKKIWIYKDKTTGKGKGEATITYDDPPTATSAISWFGGKEFQGCKLTIELAQRKNAPQFSRGGGRGGYGGAGSGGGRGGYREDRGAGRTGPSVGSGRPGDWVCSSCSNNNFAYRHECNRCKTPRPAGGDSRASNGGGGRHPDHGSRGESYAQRGNRNYRDNDPNRGAGGGRIRERENYRDQDRDRDRDRDRERDRDRSRGSSGYSNQSSGGPSRSQHGRDRDDRRSRPY